MFKEKFLLSSNLFEHGSKPKLKQDAGGSSSGGGTVGDAAAASAASSSASASIETGNPPPTQERWQDKLADEYKGNPALKDFKDINSFAKSYLDTKSLVGKVKIGVPTKDSKPEEIAEFYKQLGVPEKADLYEIKKPEKLPEGVEFNEAEAKEFSNLAFDLKLTKEQVQKLQEYDLGRRGRSTESERARQANLDKEFDTLVTQKYGDKQSEVIAKAGEMIAEYGGKEVAEMLNKLDNKQLVAVSSILYEIHNKNFKEGDLPGRSSAGTTGLTYIEAQAQLREVMSSKAYNSPFAEGKEAHEAAKIKARDLSLTMAKLQEKK